MIWIFKKVFSIGILVAVLFFALQMNIGGRPVKKYLSDFYHSRGIRTALEEMKVAVTAFLQKDVGTKSPGADEEMEKVPEEDRKELEKLLQKEVGKK